MSNATAQRVYSDPESGQASEDITPAVAQADAQSDASERMASESMAPTGWCICPKCGNSHKVETREYRTRVGETFPSPVEPDQGEDVLGFS